MLNEHEIKDQVLEQLKSFHRAEDIGIVQVSTHRFAIAAFNDERENFSKLGDGPAARNYPRARVLSSHAAMRTVLAALGLIQSELGYRLDLEHHPEAKNATGKN